MKRLLVTIILLTAAVAWGQVQHTVQLKLGDSITVVAVAEPSGTVTAMPTPIPTGVPTAQPTAQPTATPIVTAQITLPIEVLGFAPVIKSVTVNIPDVSNIASLWLRIHGMESYTDKASIRLNGGNWLNINNTNVIVEYPANLFEGIGGALNTVKFKVPIERLAGRARDSFGARAIEIPVPIPHSLGPETLAGTLVPGNNTIDFRFNKSDGLSIGFRVIGINFLRLDGTKVLADTSFTWEDPNTWQPPLNNPTDIAAGK